jgi:transcription elongation factor GreA
LVLLAWAEECRFASGRVSATAGLWTFEGGTMKARILKRFEEELGELDRELRLELPKEIQRARELGDLSENAEYQAAKERQSYVQARMGMLRKRMAEISLMNFDRLPHDRAGFGSTVHLREEGAPDTIIYQLVMPEEADAARLSGGRSATRSACPRPRACGDSSCSSS